MRRTSAVILAIIGMLSLFGCKPGTYYPFGQKVQNSDQTTSTVYYKPATQSISAGQYKANQIVPG